MKIFVDADACPKAIKSIIIALSHRTKIPVVFVANRAIETPAGSLISSIQVPHGFDIADEKIIDLVQAKDIVVTADVPLAHAVLAKKSFVINPRGHEYNEENIKDMLASRDLKEELRDFGINSKGPKAFSAKDKHKFSCTLDKIVSQNNKC